MEEFYNTDEFLARWASGDISDEERTAFENSEEYPYYKSILEATELLEVPELDSESLFEKVKLKKESLTKTKTLIPRWAYTAAAVAILLFGYFAFFNNSLGFTTGFGEQLSHVLPDASEVILNSKSSLKYNKKDWENDRKLELEGNAYFKVAKGSTFTVATANGEVTVLGTQFTVHSNTDIFEVICYEGRVNVLKGDFSKEIAPGEALRLVNNTFESWIFNETTPSWVNGESTFIDTPIHQVIVALENQYGIRFNSDTIRENLRFTGSFTHDSLEIALRTVFDSMDIKFTFINEKTIDLVEN